MNEYHKQRIQNIKSTVSIRKLIDYFKIRCQSLDLITQVHCPFHGDDLHPSARIYESNTMYCFYCSKSWDVIELVKDFKNLSFSDSCLFLEELFKLKKIDRMDIYEKRETFEDYIKETNNIKKDKNFDSDFVKINNFLIQNRNTFDMESYLKYFNLFDFLYNSYLTNEYDNDDNLQISLNSLYTEISSKV